MTFYIIYFDETTKLFSDRYLAKFLDISVRNISFSRIYVQYLIKKFAFNSSIKLKKKDLIKENINHIYFIKKFMNQLSD